MGEENTTKFVTKKDLSNLIQFHHKVEFLHSADGKDFFLLDGKIEIWTWSENKFIFGIEY